MHWLPLLLLVQAAEPHGWVTDSAGVLSAENIRVLNQRLESAAASTGHQVAVSIDRSTNGVPIEDWAAKRFEALQLGRKGFDDGAALFVFVDDRTARIEVGYGLEPVLTDVVSSRILADVLGPSMAQGQYQRAIDDTVDAMLGVLASPGPEAPQPNRGCKSFGVGALALLFVLLAVWKPHLAWLLLMSVMGRRLDGGGGFRGGGGRSGGGGASGRW
jgi:uncharacterized protein